MDGGRTRPVLLDCEFTSGPTPKRQRFVVKAKGLPEVHDFSLCNEYVGAMIAELMGLCVPAAVLVDISPEFVASTELDLKRVGLQIQPGIAVGSEYIPGLAPMPRSAELKEEYREGASAVYAFDMAVQNPDRRRSNPNCGFSGDKLVAFDFENAFSFRLMIGARPDPWRVTQLGLTAGHLFTASLRGSELNWSPTLERMTAADDEFFDGVIADVPAEWSEIVSAVAVHFDELIEHLVEFEAELKASLS